MTIKDALDLIIPEEFGPDDDGGDDTAAMEAVYDQLGKNTRTAFGVSQFVIIPEEEDYVIKVPFNGNFYFNTETNAYDIFDPYPTNFCDLSVHIYEEAVKWGVEKMLAKTEFAGLSKNHKDIYTQEQIKETEGWHYYSDESTKPSQKSIDTARETLKTRQYSAWCYFSVDWLASAIDWYGLDYVNHCMEFLEEMQVDDFHQENYGYRFDGSPVIFDYAVFFWE